MKFKAKPIKKAIEAINKYQNRDRMELKDSLKWLDNMRKEDVRRKD